MFPFLYLCVHVGCKVNGIYLIVVTFCVCELMTKITIISRGGIYFPLSLRFPGGKINVTCRFTPTQIHTYYRPTFFHPHTHTHTHTIVHSFHFF